MNNKIIITSLFILAFLSLLIAGCQSKSVATVTPDSTVEDVPKDLGDTSMPTQDNIALIDKYADTTSIDIAADELKQVE